MTETEQRFLMDQRCDRCGQIKREAKAYVGSEILCGCSPMTETVTNEIVTAALEALRQHGQDTGAVAIPSRGAIRAALSAALPMVVAGEREFVATHRHRKGGEYRIVRRGRLEWNLEPAVIYEARDGTVWVRPEAEFDDGRFTAIRSDKGGETG